MCCRLSCSPRACRCSLVTHLFAVVSDSSHTGIFGRLHYHLAISTTSWQVDRQSPDHRLPAELGRPDPSQPDKGKVYIHVDCSAIAAPLFQPDESQPPKKKKTRGPTTCKALTKHHGQDEQRPRLMVDFDGNDAAICPNKDTFATYIRTMACTKVCINIPNWHKVPEVLKDNIWRNILIQFDVPELKKKLVLEKVGKRWRAFKVVPCHLAISSLEYAVVSRGKVFPCRTGELVHHVTLSDNHSKAAVDMVFDNMGDFPIPLESGEHKFMRDTLAIYANGRRPWFF